MPSISIASALISLGAMLLVAYAVRGRRIDDHPICRKCGFDLFGKPATSIVCSECGAALERRRAIRIGHRKKRGRILALAIPLLLGCAGWDGLLSVYAAKIVDWTRHAPAWWVIRQVHSPDAASRDAALAELITRIAESKLSPAQEAALADEALSRQADLRHPWLAAWGDLVEALHDAGRLPDAQWEQYLFQSITVKLEGNPKVRLCNPYSVDIMQGTARTGSQGGLKWPDGFHVGLYSESYMRVGGILHAIDFIDHIQQSHDAPDIDGWTSASLIDTYDDTERAQSFDVPLPAPVFAGLKLGPQEIRVKFLLRAVRTGGTANSTAPLPPGRTLVASLPFTLIAPPPVNDDPALRPAVEKSLRVDKVLPPNECGWAMVYLSCNKPPIDLAYTVWVTGRDRKTGQAITTEGKPALFLKGGAVAGHELLAIFLSNTSPGPPFDVTLRPSQAVTPFVDVKEIWGGTIEFKDVTAREKARD